MDGFGEDVKRVTSCEGSIEELGGVVVSGDEQNAAIRSQLADCDCGVDSVHARHHHIRYEVVEGGLLCEFEALFCAVYGDGVEAADVENHGEGVRVGRFVVDH